MIPQQNEQVTRPWYREPMVWLIIAIPLSSVIYGTFFLIVSITSFDGMVVDDYYKVGKQINRELKRDKAALAHGLTAQVMVENKTVTVFILANQDYTAPPALEIRFFYSTRADIDKETFAELISPGIYKGSIPELETGRWNVQIASDDWRLLGSMRIPDEKKVVIKPLRK
ncbi:MAG: FixH family protein [Gammaproteobacteria bacterium]|nr:MAG: FixH family protein [Gammaproteobacteria bacterium]